MTDYVSADASLSYGVRDQWGTGFVADLELMVDQAVGPWRISFQLNADIQNIWNAKIVSHVGNVYVIEGLSYNSQLPAGGKAGFGFTAAGTDTAIDPASVVINDQPVGGGDPVPVLPVISVADVSAVEGQDLPASVPVTLSAASDQDIVVTYETFGQSAVAGQDFVATTGQLVIPAGATGGSIDIALLDDALVEGAELFGLRLTSVQGATLGDAEAMVTVQDNDVAPPVDLPVVTVTGSSVVEGDPDGGGGGGGSGAGGSFADGPLSTAGNQIVDANGTPVEIRAVNWFGFETETHVPHGLWARNWQDMMDQMQELGFNAIRLPFAGEIVQDDPMPSSINTGLNPDLAGLSAMEVMDKIVGYADQLGMRVLLDHHRSEAGNSANEGGLWTTNGYSEQDWIDVWRSLATRYQGDDTIIGADLHNEPHGPATWGDGGATDWARAAAEAGNAIHEISPDWLIVVEGIESYGGDNYWWGGNLQGVADHPVALDAGDKLVYSPHDYPASIYQQPWFSDGSDLHQVFREAWGYIYEEGIAPVLVGEFGSRLATASDQAWAEAITSYMQGDFNGDGTTDIPEGAGDISFAWWSWNPNSGDTGGILNDDWTTVRQNAIELLQPLLADPAAGGGPVVSEGDAASNFATFTIALDAPATEAVTLDYHTEDDTALAWQDYLPESGSVTFATGEQVKTVSVEILGDTLGEEDETFRLVVDGPVEGSLQAVATILDDDGGTGGGGDGGTGGGDGGTGGGDGGTGGDGPLSAEFLVRNDWGSGATVDMVVTNTGSSAISGWEVGFDLGVEIQQIWNASAEAANPDRYEVSNAAWNGSLAPGQSVTLGFNTMGGGLDPNALNHDANFGYYWF